MKHQEDFFKNNDGLKLFYQVWFPDNPKAIILIVHGFGEHSGRYKNVVDALLPEGYALYAFDLRGHGKSEGITNYVDSFDQYIDDVKTFHDLIRKTHPDLPLFLLGHSMGSCIASYFTSKYEDLLKGLILSGCGVRVGEGVNPFLKLLAGVISKIAGKSTIDTKLDPNSLSHDLSVVKAYVEDPLVHHEKISARLAHELMNRFGKITLVVSKIRIPVLIQSGSEDKAAQGIKDLIKELKTDNFTCHVYDGLYHEVYNEIAEKRKVVLEDLKNWLNKHV
ncbi:MAG: lysophospholipase [Promethearchaeota archaeon]